MRDVEVLAGLVSDYAARLRRHTAGLTLEELRWQPDDEANSIGVTLWHVGRWLDLLTVRALQNRPPEEEQWFTRGWAEKTGYDPRGLGDGGLGALSGYTWAEVCAVPVLPVDEALAYIDQACVALREHLLSMPEGSLQQPVLGFHGHGTAWEWLTRVLAGVFGHTGEIDAIKASRARRMTRAASQPA